MNISANRMQTLLVDILKYTRLKHTNNELVAINLINLLDEVKLDMAEAIAEKDAEIITAPLPEITGVGFLLKQLFVNLISNSIKYAHPDRNPVITISAAEAPQNYNGIADEFYNVLYVSDNGIGFDQKYAEQAFNIFTRLHNLPDHKGSGVGLALCKKIMQNHNGYIVASSTVNEGTTITLYFPL